MVYVYVHIYRSSTHSAPVWLTHITICMSSFDFLTISLHARSAEQVEKKNASKEYARDERKNARDGRRRKKKLKNRKQYWADDIM